jgi:hypothetical protein
MKRAVRDDLLRVLAEFSDQAPDLRLGQLICNLAFLARATGPSDTWEVEDEELLEAARSFLLDLERRREAPVSGTPA